MLTMSTINKSRTTRNYCLMMMQQQDFM